MLQSFVESFIRGRATLHELLNRGLFGASGSSEPIEVGRGRSDCFGGRSKTAAVLWATSCGGRSIRHSFGRAQYSGVN
jgi:hypothetical protein